MVLSKVLPAPHTTVIRLKDISLSRVNWDIVRPSFIFNAPQFNSPILKRERHAGPVRSGHLWHGHHEVEKIYRLISSIRDFKLEVTHPLLIL